MNRKCIVCSDAKPNCIIPAPVSERRCDHSVCVSCFTSIISSSIMNNSVHEVSKCQSENCGNKYTIDQIREFCEARDEKGDLLEKFIGLLKAYTVIVMKKSDEMLLYDIGSQCSMENCSWHCIIKTNCPAVFCQNCNEVYCAICHRPTHEREICAKPEDCKASEIRSYFLSSFAWHEDALGKNTYCIDCNSKIVRSNGCSRVVCTSEFCQMSSAQCQICKSRLDLDARYCQSASCRINSRPKIMNLFTVEVETARGPRKFGILGTETVKTLKLKLEELTSEPWAHIALKVNNEELADTQPLNFYRVTQSTVIIRKI